VNWKSSLTGAVIVAAAGLAAGFAVGGKTTTRTRTMTVAQTVTATVTSTASQNPGSTSNTTRTKPSTGTSNGNSSGSSQQYYADYLSSQDSSQLNNNATNVSMDENPTSLQLNGQTYAHAVAFDLNNNSNTQPVTESYQLPVPGFRHFSASLAGLATNASAKASYKLTIYKNNDNPGATALFSASFAGPSGTHPISFDTQGATDIVLDWGEPSSGEPDDPDQFILADPVVAH
jgi:hypothetical protein